MVETKSEASTVRAGVTGTDQNGDEITLGIRCYSMDDPKAWLGQPSVTTTIFVGSRFPDLKNVPIGFSAAFDGGNSINLGEFGFNQGVLIAPLRPQVIALLVIHKEMKLLSENGAISAIFSLENAGSAIADVQCWGDKIQ